MAADLTSLIGIPSGAAGVAIPLYLWLSNKVRLTSDVDKQLAEKDKRIDELIAERNNWRQAHADEVDARQTSQRANVQLLDSAALSSQLLDVLRDQLHVPKPQAPPRRRVKRADP